MNEWQDFKTAPHDGTEIQMARFSCGCLIFETTGFVLADDEAGGYATKNGLDGVTHWKPLSH